MKVLIVEDSNVMRGIIRYMIPRLGYDDVVEAEDGQQAWEHLTQESFDLMLTDWNMPRMSGLELLQKVRDAPDTASLPVVMLTMESESWIAILGALVGAVSVTIGVLVERWLFFAEAKHTVSLYYGADEA